MQTTPSQPDHNNPNAPKPRSGWSRAMGWAVLIVGIVAFGYLYNVYNAGSFSQTASAGAGHDLVPWAAGLEQGSERAEAEGKPMLVNFTADWCPPCQWMKAEVFSQQAVAKAITADFVPVKVDMTAPARGGPEERAAMRYGVRGIPTYIAIDAAGREIARTGPQGARELLIWLSQVQADGPQAD